MVREPVKGASENILPHAAGFLFQQYVCDAYSRAEAQRLLWSSERSRCGVSVPYGGFVPSKGPRDDMGAPFCYRSPGETPGDPQDTSPRRPLASPLPSVRKMVGRPGANKENRIPSTNSVRKKGGPWPGDPPRDPPGDPRGDPQRDPPRGSPPRISPGGDQWGSLGVLQDQDEPAYIPGASGMERSFHICTDSPYLNRSEVTSQPSRLAYGGVHWAVRCCPLYVRK